MSVAAKVPRLKLDAWADLVEEEFLDEFEKRQATPVNAVATPIPAWNQVCGDDGGGEGLALGWFVTVGGNPGFGKSLLALNLGYHALSRGWRVGFLSLEMSEFQLAGRLYAMATATPVHRLQRGRSFDPGTFALVRDGIARIMEENQLARFWVNRKNPRSVDDILVAMKILQEQEGVSVFIIDYLQLVGIGDEESVFRQMTEATTRIRDYAKHNEVLVIGLSQFQRRTSADYTQSPMVQGLHGGMILEASSDQVLLLDHSRYQRDEMDQHLARSWFVVGKNRHGRLGEIPVLWDYTHLRVREALPDEESRWPQHGKRGMP